MIYGQLVYFIRFSGTNYYKVGKTGNLLGRLAQLRTAMPLDPKVIVTARVRNAEIVENSLKLYLHPYSTPSGGTEWYELEEEQVDFIVNYLKMVEYLDKFPETSTRKFVKKISTYSVVLDPKDYKKFSEGFENKDDLIDAVEQAFNNKLENLKTEFDQIINK